MVGVPDHLVFLREDKSVLSRRSGRADLTGLPSWAPRGVVVRLSAQVETLFVVRAGEEPVGGVEFTIHPAGNQRQNTKRLINHDFPSATTMPQERSLLAE